MTGRRRWSRVGLTAAAIFIAAYAIAPLWWAAAGSFRTSTDIFAHLNPLEIEFWIPTTPTLDNFAGLLAGSFGMAIFNSVLITVVAVAVGLLLSAMAAFALSAIRFRGRDLVFAVIVISFLLPFDAVAIPLASQFRSVGLQNSYPALILPGIANGMVIFLLRQFFLGIPSEIVDAARVDGLGWPGVFWRIYLPLSRPAMIGGALLLGVFQWHAYLWPLIIASVPDKLVAPVAIASFAGQFETDFGQMFAATTITVVIPMLVLLRFQKHFVRSVASSGGK